jgi:hypothetical protein
VNLYADKYEEEFQPHLPAFTTAIWGLLMKVWMARSAWFGCSSAFF